MGDKIKKFFKQSMGIGWRILFVVSLCFVIWGALLSEKAVLFCLVILAIAVATIVFINAKKTKFWAKIAEMICGWLILFWVYLFLAEVMQAVTMGLSAWQGVEIGFEVVLSWPLKFLTVLVSLLAIFCVTKVKKKATEET